MLPVLSFMYRKALNRSFLDDDPSINTCIFIFFSSLPGNTWQWSELGVFSKLALARAMLQKGEML